ncbi:MAG: hypothetical protein M1821_003743 [Bathelium mastoideum]|nr:MAG: hypothetical protein M1821_003743 [Bathelium mastoideum]KAI9690826.1 MAG: hypothetical protein M1822_008445 [Bathelium mastoideum]
MSLAYGWNKSTQNHGPGGQSYSAAIQNASTRRDGWVPIRPSNQVGRTDEVSKAAFPIQNPSSTQASSVSKRANVSPPTPYQNKRHQPSTIQQSTLAPIAATPSAMPPAYYGRTVWDQHPASENWVHGYVIKEEFEEGAIILAPYLEPLYNTKIQPGEADRAETQIGAACAKHRPFILLSKCADHFEAIPLYTYQGLGVESKSLKVQGEHVSIARAGYPCKKQGPHQPLYLEPVTQWKVKETCVAHFTEVTSFSYSCPVKSLGYINRESYIHLAELHLKNVHESIGNKVASIKGELRARQSLIACSQVSRRMGAVRGASTYGLAEVAA